MIPATATETDGGTPLIEVDGVLAKLACVNPTGSIKDRIALAWLGRERGHPVTIVMPEDMTEERTSMIRSLGAELVLCGAGGFAEAAAVRDRLAGSRRSGASSARASTWSPT